jgi:hypothetical protein
MAEGQINWLDQTTNELYQLIEAEFPREGRDFRNEGKLIDFVRLKLLESYKNGLAAALRRQKQGQRPARTYQGKAA